MMNQLLMPGKSYDLSASQFIEAIPSMENDEINWLLTRAERLRQSLDPPGLPAHLEEQELHLMAEKERRKRVNNAV